METEAEAGRDLNAVPLQNAVLCVDCETVSNSPQDHCLVCGSHSLLNMARLLGGTLPGERAAIIETEAPEDLPQFVLHFPKHHGRPCRKMPPGAKAPRLG